jgi:hypothetical protein
VGFIKNELIAICISSEKNKTIIVIS